MEEGTGDTLQKVMAASLREQPLIPCHLHLRMILPVYPHYQPLFNIPYEFSGYFVRSKKLLK